MVIMMMISIADLDFENDNDNEHKQDYETYKMITVIDDHGSKNYNNDK